MRQFGKFRLVEHLASGGMAEVWRAEMPGAAGFVKEVALKLVRGEHREDDAFTRMFIQEARLASRLDHANVVHVFELGQVDGQYYIAMELVRGRTLRDVVDRCRELGVRFGVPRAVHVGAEVARALAYAHRLEVDGRAAGLVHRDVSPQNVLVSYEGEVKLADFGIARAAARASADERTRAGTIKGKLAYMAPEQARGEPVDGRADVFALGVMLWELCTGSRLFARDGDAATLAALLDGAPVSRPSEWNDAVPPELDAAIAGALERDRERRTRSAAELERALAGLRHRLAASNPEEIDLRALLLRLWPEGAASRAAPREQTAVMQREPAAATPGPAVPFAAEPERGAAPAEGERAAVLAGVGGGAPPTAERGEAVPNARDPSAEPTRTLVKPRPFSRHDQNRRTLLLLLVLAFGGAVAYGVLKWAGSGADERERASGASRPEDAREQGTAGARSPGAVNAPASNADVPPSSGAASPSRDANAAAEDTRGPARDGAHAPQPPTPGAAPREDERRADEQRPRPHSPANAGGAARNGRATLVVDILPWATVYVDGKRMGDTPLTLDLAAGAHELRAVHPKLGSARHRVELAPGQQLRWAPQLSR